MKYKILALIANHTSNKVKYNISLNNIAIIKEFVSKITIIDSNNEYYAEKLKEDLENNDKILDYYLVENNTYYDFGKWTETLKKTDIDDFDYILLLNDSIILTFDIQKYFHYIDNIMDDKTNLYAYNDSNQLKTYHYQSYLFLIKKSISNKFINFFESKKYLINDLESLIINAELKICDIDENHDVFIKIANEYNIEKNLYWENEDLYKHLLDKNIFAIIKLKKIFDIQKTYKISIYGDSIISEFDHKFYKDYYNFNDLTDEEAFNHFINYGQYEGRKYTKKINTVLPKYYIDKLDNNNLLYFFDIPDNFDVYYYKLNNPDISNLSTLDTIYHYINYGFYEGRIYNKCLSKNSYLNNFYLKILSRLDNIYSLELPDNFNIHATILLNNLLDIHEYYSIIKKYLVNKKLLYDRDILNEKLLTFDYNNYIKINNIENIDLMHAIQHFIVNYTTNKIYKVPKDFNHDLYKRIYKDLNKFDNLELERHYILFGYNEGRYYKLPTDFNPKEYKKIYSDLSNLTDDQLCNHYLYNGYNEKRLYKLPIDFNPLTYKKMYKDLSDLNENELREHYATKGIKNRIYKIPDDFDPLIYKKIYSNLSDMDDQEVIDHYLSFGLQNKLVYKLPKDFNPTLYKKIYSDLIHLDDNQIINHYLSIGIKENRLYKLPEDFNITTFKKINREFNDLSDDDIIKYFITEGIKNNKLYKLPKDFDPDTYKKIYNDLESLKHKELGDHYINFGIHEKRVYKLPDDFDSTNYKKINTDLEKLSDQEAIKHYLSYGIHENRKYKIDNIDNIDKIDRINVDKNELDEIDQKEKSKNINNNSLNIIPNDFNPKNYKKINHDLINLTDKEAINHYLNYGMEEKRYYKIPDDFNVANYKKIYSDLSKLSDQEAKNHYLFNGINEKRIYKIPNDFNITKYKNMYNDLSEFIDKEIENHYLFYGVRENRIYK